MMILAKKILGELILRFSPKFWPATRPIKKDGWTQAIFRAVDLLGIVICFHKCTPWAWITTSDIQEHAYFMTWFLGLMNSCFRCSLTPISQCKTVVSMTGAILHHAFIFNKPWLFSACECLIKQYHEVSPTKQDAHQACE